MKPTVALLTAILTLLGAANAWAFDFDRYQAADLDALLEQKRPDTGVDVYPGRPLRLTATLTAYGQRCKVGFLKKTMTMMGVPRETVDTLPVTQCLKIRSAKGRDVTVFIQDPVAAFLPKEVPLGKTLTLFAIHLFTDRNGPGLLVNEFRADAASNPPATGDKAAGCGCGGPDFHPGMDFAADEGMAVPVADDGVVGAPIDARMVLTASLTACARPLAMGASSFAQSRSRTPYPTGSSTKFSRENSTR